MFDTNTDNDWIRSNELQSLVFEVLHKETLEIHWGMYLSAADEPYFVTVNDPNDRTICIFGETQTYDNIHEAFNVVLWYMQMTEQEYNQIPPSTTNKLLKMFVDFLKNGAN